MIEFIFIVCVALMIGAHTPEEWKQIFKDIEE